jgi:hypothetical protein
MSMEGWFMRWKNRTFYKTDKLEARADSESQYLFEISAAHGGIKG